MRRLPFRLSRAGLSSRLSRVRRSVAGARTADGLLVPLVLGVGVVLILTCISPTAYRDAPVIVQTHMKDTKAVHDASTKRLPVVVLPLEGAGGAERTVENDGGLYAVRERMAVNILLRTGYLERAVALHADDPARLVSYVVAADDEARQCGSLQRVDANEPDLSFLALAVVATEKFNRSGLHRFLEWRLADTVRAATGRLPDLSLGVAQIRPSTIRRYAETSPALHALVPKTDDASLRVLLGDECRSLALAAALLQAMATEPGESTRCSGYDYSCLEFAVLRYGGHRHRSNAVVDYLGLVRTMKDLLEQGIPETAGDEVPAACGETAKCDAPASPASPGSPDTSDPRRLRRSMRIE